jgi:YD repeat-containing protein
MKVMKSTFALLLLLIAAAPLSAQQSPATARGFDPDKVFAVGPVDNVNVFSGNLIATIPLGETYAVSPGLSYSLKAIHNGKTWDYTRRYITLILPCDTPQDTECTREFTDFEAIPDGTANAGFGWRVQFARFIRPGDLAANIDRMLFETPDGAQHALYDSLHDGGPADAGYTRDGSYFRYRGIDSTRSAVDAPDGVTYEFTNYVLTQIHDQVKDAGGAYVNHVDFKHPTASDVTPCTTRSLSWLITDSLGRTQHVCMSNKAYDGKSLPTVTDVYVQSPAGSAHYTFNQTQTVFGRENFDQGYQYLYLPATVSVPALTSITLPDGSSYGFEYWGTSVHPGYGTGNLASLKLPTGGSYSYNFARYSIPSSHECLTDEEWRGSYTAGVSERVERDASGGAKGTAFYGPEMLSHGIEGGIYQCTTEQEGPGYFQAFSPGAEWRTVTIPADNLSRTSHYYSVWPGYNRLYVDSPDGFRRSDYGLPFTRDTAVQRDGLWLSTQTYLCTDARNQQCDATPIRATYVDYEVDAEAPNTFVHTFDHNARLRKSETVYFDDGAKTSVVTNSNFDALGHYRVTETSGFGTTNKRRVTTDYNGTDGTSLPAATAPWLLNLFTFRETKDLDSTGAVLSSAKAEVCFGTDGLLNRQRTVTGGGIDPKYDLLAVFTHDSVGNVATESYFGGDRLPLPIGFDTCNGSISGPQYRISHDYAAGVVTRSQYDGTTFNSYEVVPYTTGAPNTIRDSAGIPTTFTYDGVGRLIEIHPQGIAWTEYEYTLPTSSSGVAAVAVRQRPEGAAKTTAAIAEQRFYFDGVGRLIQRKSAMPVGEWATIRRTYDSSGRIDKEYVPYVSTSAAFDASFTPATFTQYAYDKLGRVISVTAPDGKVVATSYSGASEQEKTTSVATTVTGETLQTTKYAYDYLGRLTQVKEKNDTITASYGYDLADRLSSVLMSGPEGSQSRSFTYDNRGFLTSETHPENGTTTYQQYDARGHFWEKRTAGDSAFDLNMTFDSAERVTQVDSRNPYYVPGQSQPQWRPSKSFAFATANTATSFVRGKLSASQRHNYQPALGDILVTEALEYNNGGRPSKKTTTVTDHTQYSDNTIQSFEQNFTYDSLGNILGAGYPACLTKWCGGSPLASFDYGYENGYLTSIPGFVDNISYYPTGVVKQVNHSSGVTTLQVQDASGMARVKSITVSNFGNCAVPVPVINSQPADLSISAGGTATLTVYATGSSLQYQWFNAATAQPIAGATATSYTTPVLTQTASYYVVISTPCGSTQSRSATITVCTTPSIDVQPNDVVVAVNGSTTLIVHANGGPLQYQWYDATAGQAIAGATSASYTTPALTQTRSYYVVISTPCDTSTVSRIAVVTPCTAPSLAAQPASTTVVSGTTTTLIANATGTSLHYTWYSGFSGDASQPVGSDSSSFTSPAITAVRRYWVRVTNTCGTVSGGTLTLTPLLAPSSVVATVADATHVSVAWPPAINAVQYRIVRREQGSGLRTVNTVSSSTTAVVDTVATNLAYLYCIQAVDSAGASTPCSAADVASTRPFTSIASGGPIYAANYQEILDGINAVYDISGSVHVGWAGILPAGVPAPASRGFIVAQHVLSLRNAITAARTQAAQSSGVTISSIAFTDPQLNSTVPILAIHTQELQGGLK